MMAHPVNPSALLTSEHSRARRWISSGIRRLEGPLLLLYSPYLSCPLMLLAVPSSCPYLFRPIVLENAISSPHVRLA